MFLYLNVTIIIKTLINIFKINNVKLLVLINKSNIDKLPMKAPIIILFIFIFLFNTIETLDNSKKSKAKFKNNTKSRYIFILITTMIIKKRHRKLCRFKIIH